MRSGWPTRWGLPGRSEAAVGGALLGIAAILVLPLPPWAMDALLSCNLALSLVLLLLAARAGAALQVSAFPTLLLMATLFRLALNVSTTRLILGRADAGRVVQAFGEFATAGDPVVGGVVFLILTVVQFIVIAKGAERVAEVTARFHLDGLPGKQMSIDADLRAGLLDAEAAGRRRLELERESQFHGAMDGAMKFIKGDAVAGLVITAVNLVGGLLIGCLQRGLGAAEAASTYSVLTIGDGLVTQIPALLVSTAAGLLVTRVRPERAEQGLGRQLGSQLGAHPEALVLAGGALALIGLVPGMPGLAFGGLGACLAGAGAWLGRRASRRAAAAEVPARGRRGGCLELRLPADPPAPGFWEGAEALRRAVGDELGVPLPPLVRGPGAQGGRWTLLLDGAPAAAGALAAGPAGLEAGLRRAAARCVGVQETQDLLDALERDQPALVREVVPRLVPPVLLSEVLTRLVEEQVPVACLRAVLTSLAEHARQEADPAVLAERVREGLRPFISHRLAPEGRLRAWLLDPELERRVAAAVVPGAAGASLVMEPAEAEAVLAGLERALGGARAEGAPVVLCRPEVRRPFWRLVGAVFPDVRVVSFLELEPQVAIQPVGRVGLGAPSPARGGGR
ncbi:MAG TPA: flagellar biosynthesis protein FlhA [Myxococcota bacterium]|nr:flagellar biosynthesis protein FlhA [Myxococcota bacterium]HRY94753.1 flagellar biosynthesis protein FlhA [Myxococcota bacterium]HSA20830.1 flagellar biosynthesis protein FlhA [Myxococcota bacterium]